MRRFSRVSPLVLWISVVVMALAPEGISQETPEPEITIDAGDRREPISKYIYGQFIEHLGRCIYGGIWAEMLEDRKFYFPVTAKYDPYRFSDGMARDARFPLVGASPWEIIGDSAGVKMVEEDSFVGDHTPRLAAGSGIRQNDLGVVAGKSYVGHIWLRAEPGAGGKATVALVWADGAEGRQTRELSVTDRYERHSLRFTAGASTDSARLEVRAHGAACFVGTASLMPADNVRGLRADTLALLKELDSPMYRWPGGNFVSGYDWRDGIGDRDRRPPRKNPAWTGVEHNDFGLDEFLDFCHEVDAEPLVTVNTGFGDAYSAAQEVEYANGSVDTIGGSWRAKNGRREPYAVRWWCVGNEMFGDWQLGYMKLDHYVLKHNDVSRYMLQADPTIRLIAVGNAGDWSRGMLRGCADRMDLISEHFYVWRELDDVAAHVEALRAEIRKKVEAHRTYRREMRQLAGKDIRIAMDEWNYWYRPYVYGELGCVYRLRDALGVAAGLHEYFRHSDICFMAHYAQTVNVIGCIKTTKTRAGFATTGLPLALYRKRFGTVPVGVKTSAEISGIDVAAAWTADGTALTIGIVNPLRRAVTIRARATGARLGADGTVWTIAGDDPRACNEPGAPPAVEIREAPARFEGKLDVPPLSVRLYRFPAR